MKKCREKLSKKKTNPSPHTVAYRAFRSHVVESSTHGPRISLVGRPSFSRGFSTATVNKAAPSASVFTRARRNILAAQNSTWTSIRQNRVVDNCPAFGRILSLRPIKATSASDIYVQRRVGRFTRRKRNISFCLRSYRKSTPHYNRCLSDGDDESFGTIAVRRRDVRFEKTADDIARGKPKLRT